MSSKGFSESAGPAAEMQLVIKMFQNLQDSINEIKLDKVITTEQVNSIFERITNEQSLLDEPIKSVEEMLDKIEENQEVINFLSEVACRQEQKAIEQ